MTPKTVAGKAREPAPLLWLQRKRREDIQCDAKAVISLLLRLLVKPI
jgi:hypothetical protein